MSLLEAPDDVLIHIFLNLNLLGLIACEKTCRRVHQLIQCDSSLKYRKEALSYGIRPSLGASETPSTALSALEDREKGWRELSFETLGVHDPDGGCFKSCLAGDYYYMLPSLLSGPMGGAHSHILRLHIPSNILERTWLPVPFSPGEILDLVVDGEQDMLVWVTYPATNAVLQMHYCSATTGQENLETQSLVFGAFRNVHSLWTQLRANHVCILLELWVNPANKPGCQYLVHELIIADWRTGRRKHVISCETSASEASRNKIDSVVFLNDRMLLTSSSETLRLLTFSKDDESIQCVAILSLTGIIKYSSAPLRSAKFLSNGYHDSSLTADFYPIENGLIACNFEASEFQAFVTQKRQGQVVLVFSASQLLALCIDLVANYASSVTDASDAGEIDWNTWSKRVRYRTLQVKPFQVGNVYRNRITLLFEDQYGCNITLFDFTRYNYRPGSRNGARADSLEPEAAPSPNETDKQESMLVHSTVHTPTSRYGRSLYPMAISDKYILTREGDWSIKILRPKASLNG